MLRWIAVTLACVTGLACGGSGFSAEVPASGRDQPIVVALNPQPLPPRVASRVIRRDPLTGRAIIIVSGRGHKVFRGIGNPGGKVMLNPQPLPPRTRRSN